MPSERTSDIQRRIFEFIIDYMRSRGRPPTNRKIGKAMNITTTGHVDYHLSVLEKKGYIIRQTKTSRGIELTRRVQGIPVMGRIAAGEPLDIFTEPDETIDIGHDLEQENVYALIVKGRSMIEDYICDGDYLIIKQQIDCENGDIVVAVHLPQGSSGSVMLKRFFQEKELDRVRLQPANSEMNPIYVTKSEWDREWQVQGRVVAIFRPFMQTSQTPNTMGSTKAEIEATAIKALREASDELSELIKQITTNLLSTEPVLDKGEKKLRGSEAVPVGELNPASSDQDEKIVKTAREVVNLAIQQEAAVERIIIAAKSTREQLDQIYGQGHSQAKSWFLFSLIAAIIGFLVILSGVVVAIATANIPIGILTSVASIVPNTISVLFFQQAREANKRLDDFYGKLIELEEINQAIELSLTTNEEIQDRYKGLIIFRQLGLQTTEQEIPIMDLLTKSNART